jgi:hypothetical protein
MKSIYVSRAIYAYQFMYDEAHMMYVVIDVESLRIFSI